MNLLFTLSIMKDALSDHDAASWLRFEEEQLYAQVVPAHSPEAPPQQPTTKSGRSKCAISDPYM